MLDFTRTAVFAFCASTVLCGFGPGDRFVVDEALRAAGLESPGRQPALTDEYGAPAQIEDIANRTLVVRSFDARTQRITFSLTGSRRRYFAVADRAQSAVAGLTAVTDDRESMTLDARFGRRTAWTVTTLQAVCASGSADPLVVVGADVPVAIEHIVRLRAFPTNFVNIGKLAGGEGFSYRSNDPLLVTLRLPSDILTAQKKTCDEFSARFAGEWDFERQFRPRSLRASHPDWPPSTFAEVHAGRVLVGMTRDEIVAMQGYPSMPGTISDLYTLDAWRYADAGGPFGSWTIYFRGDRVWAYDPPAQQP